MLTVGWLAAIASSATVSVSPGQDWCGPANSAAPGDEIVLEPGDHDGPCALRAPGVTLRGDNARIVYSGSSSNVLDVEADDVTIETVEIGPTNYGIDGIKIKSGDRTTVRGNRFVQVGGISVAANSADSTGVVIEDNAFEDLQATGVYLGCHDGATACSATDFRFTGNVIDGVTSAGVGYGIEVKVDSWGVLADNVITDTQGPAIHVFGSYDDALVTIVEGNYLSASRVNNVLEIGGGPAVVRNNVAVGSSTAGLYVYDYGGRGLARDVQVVGNTLAGSPAVSLAGSVWVPGSSHAFENNAVDGPLPALVSGIPMSGNVDCSGGGCWTAGYLVDPSGPLAGAGVTPSFGANDLDFCGASRGSPPTVGALEVDSTPALAIGPKADFGCEPATTTGTTGTGTTGAGTGTGGTGTGTTGGDTGPTGGTADKGCGCSTGSGSISWFLLALLGLRRRR